MPTGTRVDKMYKHLLSTGKYDKSTAARIAQAKTGLSLVTGKAPSVPRRKNGSSIKLKKRV